MNARGYESERSQRSTRIGLSLFEARQDLDVPKKSAEHPGEPPPSIQLMPVAYCKHLSPLKMLQGADDRFCRRASGDESRSQNVAGRIHGYL
jgi:hypothetical protein